MVRVPSIAPKGKLRLRRKEKPFVTEKPLGAKNPVIRSGAERQIVAVDSALGRSLHFHFIEFLFDSATIPGGQFEARREIERTQSLRMEKKQADQELLLPEKP